MATRASRDDRHRAGARPGRRGGGERLARWASAAALAAGLAGGCDLEARKRRQAASIERREQAERSRREAAAAGAPASGAAPAVSSPAARRP